MVPIFRSSSGLENTTRVEMHVSMRAREHAHATIQCTTRSQSRPRHLQKNVGCSVSTAAHPTETRALHRESRAQETLAHLRTSATVFRTFTARGLALISCTGCGACASTASCDGTHKCIQISTNGFSPKEEDLSRITTTHISHLTEWWSMARNTLDSEKRWLFESRTCPSNEVATRGECVEESGWERACDAMEASNRDTTEKARRGCRRDHCTAMQGLVEMTHPTTGPEGDLQLPATERCHRKRLAIPFPRLRR